MPDLDLNRGEHVLHEALLWLDKLGSTADEVARTLADLGVKGRPRKADQCPVSRYLADRMQAAVSTTLQLFDVDGMPACLAWLPEPVSAFVRRFDAGEYPHLKEAADG